MNNEELQQAAQNLKKISETHHNRIAKFLGIKPSNKQTKKAKNKQPITVPAHLPLSTNEKIQQSLLQAKTKFYGVKATPEDVRRLKALEEKEVQAQFQAKFEKQMNQLKFQIQQASRTQAVIEKHERVLHGTKDTPGLFSIFEKIIESRNPGKNTTTSSGNANFMESIAERIKSKQESITRLRANFKN